LEGDLKVKKYSIASLHRGYQIHLELFAESEAAAIRATGIGRSHFRNYASSSKMEKTFDGVHGYIDSGWIIFEKDRKDLNQKRMPLEDLKKIIDTYTDERYQAWWKSVKP
jgi:hypothetical protein